MILDRQYYREWESINHRLRELGFTWGSLVDRGEVCQYMLLDLFRMPEHIYESILRATGRIARIYQKTVRFLQQSHFLFPSLCLPPNTWKAVCLSSPSFSYISRMDLVVKNDGKDIKILEINCDTPTGIVEAAVANKVLCEYFGARCPNHVLQEIKNTFCKIKSDYQIPDEATVFFLSYDWHEEDRQTTEFLRLHSGFSNTKYLPIKNLRVSKTGVYTSEGEPVQYLYRLYPLEYFSADKGPNNEPIGEWFLHHVAEKRIQLINPPSAFLGQCKITMAVIWALHEHQHPFFTDEEHDIIEQYFLPTYTTPNILRPPFVQKPVWGREGGGVSIQWKDGKVTEDLTSYYCQQPKIYQQYVELPPVTVQTWEGPYTGFLLVGSFLLGDVPSGIFLRVGEKITGNLSMFLPVCVE